MYKRLFLLIAIIMVFGYPQASYANFGAHQDPGYGSNICTACHRNHEVILSQSVEEENFVTGQATNQYDICTTCHNPEGTGADTDVIYGVYRNSAHGEENAALNGGGFEKVGGDDGDDNNNSENVTSTHSADGTHYPIFGNSTGNTIALTCTSCHDPDSSSNYRLLKDMVNGKDVSGFVGSNEPGFSPTTHEDFEAAREGEIDLTYEPNYTTPNYKKSGDVRKGITGWCAACHDQYFSDSSEEHSKDPDSGRRHYFYTDSEGKKRYRHAVNVRIGNNPTDTTETDLPLAKEGAGTSDNNPDNFVVCLTCHRAHGTNATMTDLAKVEPTKSASSSGPGQSALLRLPNRGVCQNCHKKL